MDLIIHQKDEIEQCFQPLTDSPLNDFSNWFIISFILSYIYFIFGEDFENCTFDFFFKEIEVTPPQPTLSNTSSSHRTHV